MDDNDEFGEPPPKPAAGDLWLEVIADMKKRRQFGIEKYGTPLQANNGRRPERDAYEEALDLCVYLKQQAIEVDALRAGSLTALTLDDFIDRCRAWAKEKGKVYGPMVGTFDVPKMVEAMVDEVIAAGCQPEDDAAVANDD